MKNQAEDKVGIIVNMSLSDVVNFLNPSISITIIVNQSITVITEAKKDHLFFSFNL